MRNRIRPQGKTARYQEYKELLSKFSYYIDNELPSNWFRNGDEEEDGDVLLQDMQRVVRDSKEQGEDLDVTLYYMYRNDELESKWWDTDKIGDILTNIAQSKSDADWDEYMYGSPDNFSEF